MNYIQDIIGMITTSNPAIWYSFGIAFGSVLLALIVGLTGYGD